MLHYGTCCCGDVCELWLAVYFTQQLADCSLEQWHGECWLSVLSCLSFCCSLFVLYRQCSDPEVVKSVLLRLGSHWYEYEYVYVCMHWLGLHYIVNSVTLREHNIACTITIMQLLTAKLSGVNFCCFHVEKRNCTQKLPAFQGVKYPDRDHECAIRLLKLNPVDMITMGSSSQPTDVYIYSSGYRTGHGC